jgi:hypothetical protein
MFAAEQAGARVRSVALLALGALAVHALRYALAPGQEEAGGHAYLHLLAPLLIAVAAAALAVSLLAPVIHRRIPRMADPASATERAAAYALLLLAIFFAQELLEALISGAPGEAVGAVAGPAGWMALPLAMLFGALAEAASHLLGQAEIRVAAAVARPRRRSRRPLPRPVAPDLVPLCSRPMAFGLGRRPPPLAAR